MIWSYPNRIYRGYPKIEISLTNEKSIEPGTLRNEKSIGGTLKFSEFSGTPYRFLQKFMKKIADFLSKIAKFSPAALFRPIWLRCAAGRFICEQYHI